MKLIGIDVGGTFTDIVFTDTLSGHTLIHKSPTTPDDPSHGVVTGVSELCARFPLLPVASITCCTARPSPPTRCSNTMAR